MAEDGGSHVDVSDEALQKFLGVSSFGKQSRHPAEEQPSGDGDATKNGQVRHSLEKSTSSQGEASSNERSDAGASESDDSDDDEPEFPISQSLRISTHSRAVTALTLDPAGNRLITGSLDSTLKLHDFSSWTPTTIRAFKSVDPSNPRPTASSTAESHPINYIAFNTLAPSQILVVDATAQAKLVSREGEVLSECVKGDMYLRDMHNTKGHISEITSGAWHPARKEVFATAATDSTIRIWDVEKPRQQRDVIVFKSRQAGNAGRTRMTALAWGHQTEPKQNMILAAAYDGTLVMFPGDGPYSRPAAEVRDAHQPGTWTSGIDISPDGRLAVTRGGDDLIKVWDLRKLKTPVNTTSHESTSAQYPMSNIRFHPTGSSIITGSGTGDLHILNPATLRPEKVVPVTPGKPLITVLWHPKLNQIVTGSADATTNVLWDATISQGGAKAVMARAPKRRHIDDDPSLTTDMSAGLSGDAIIVPGGTVPSTASFASRHPNVGLTASGRSRDPRRPHVPATTPFAKSNPGEDYVRTQIPLSSMRDEDPREALLKYASAEKDPVFTAAWSKTQPKTIYGELSDDEEDEDGRDKKRPRQ